MPKDVRAIPPRWADEPAVTQLDTPAWSLLAPKKLDSLERIPPEVQIVWKAQLTLSSGVLCGQFCRVASHIAQWTGKESPAEPDP